MVVIISLLPIVAQQLLRSRDFIILLRYDGGQLNKYIQYIGLSLVERVKVNHILNKIYMISATVF